MLPIKSLSRLAGLMLALMPSLAWTQNYTAPTVTPASDSTNKIATTAFVHNAIGAFALQIGVTSITGGPSTGLLCNVSGILNNCGFTAPTVTTSDNSTNIATTAFVNNFFSGFANSLTVGSTVINGGTTLGLLYNNAGVLGNSNFAQLTTNGAGTPTLFLGTLGPSNDDAALLISRNPNIVSANPAGAHGIRDESQFVVNVTGGAFAGYTTVDCAYSETGTATTAQNHDRCFQARASINITGTINEFAMFWSGPTVTGAATSMPTLIHFQATTANISGGAGVVNQYAFHADTLSGAASNWFLFGGNNPSALAGDLFIGGALNPIGVEKVNISFLGTSNHGLAFLDSNAAAGTTTAVDFWRNNTPVGTITTTLTGTQFNITSDERLKIFHGRYDARDAERIIRADPVKTFEWKSTHAFEIGWGAQHSFAISHDFATPGEGEPGEDGFRPWMRDDIKRMPHLWTAVGDLLDRVDALEQEQRN